MQGYKNAFIVSYLNHNEISHKEWNNALNKITETLLHYKNIITVNEIYTKTWKSKSKSFLNYTPLFYDTGRVSLFFFTINVHKNSFILF